MPDSTTLLIRIRYETNHYCFIAKCKQEKKRFATITAYDYSFAKLFAEEGLNVMLVGDSLGMTVQGMTPRYRLPLLISPTTLPPCVAARQTAFC